MNSKENLEGMIISLSNTGYDFFLNNFIPIILGLFIYGLFSIFILKPYAKNKGLKGMGGNVVVKADPFLIVLPVLFLLTFSACWLIISFTTFNNH